MDAVLDLSLPDFDLGSFSSELSSDPVSSLEELLDEPESSVESKSSGCQSSTSLLQEDGSFFNKRVLSFEIASKKKHLCRRPAAASSSSSTIRSYQSKLRPLCFLIEFGSDLPSGSIDQIVTSPRQISSIVTQVIFKFLETIWSASSCTLRAARLLPIWSSHEVRVSSFLKYASQLSKVFRMRYLAICRRSLSLSCDSFLLAILAAAVVIHGCGRCQIARKGWRKKKGRFAIPSSKV